MKIEMNTRLLLIFIFFSVFLMIGPALAQKIKENPAQDEKVRQFLKSREGEWYDMNVPTNDGQILFDLIIKNKYKNALEIGTSTGHSGIWIAWALSKTGGKLTTIEIDEDRYKTALANFKAAGLSEFIDARLADAHELVKQLPGPFDFVFCDADKEWYKNYFIAVAPKMQVGGCFTAHNVQANRRRFGWIKEFLDQVESQSDFETTIDKSSSAGISISSKKAGK
jgi:predicted O-methyltransferase YrrM